MKENYFNTFGAPLAPCKGCKERQIEPTNCHSTCEKYLQYKNAHEECKNREYEHRRTNYLLGKSYYGI